MSGYPNLFLLLGPNLGTGHSSAFSIIEAQLDYVVAALGEMRRRQAAILDVRAVAEAAFNAELDVALPGTVYNSGCASYYLDENGRNAYAWPWSTPALEARMRRFDPDAHAFLRSPSVASAVRPAEVSP